MPEVKEVSKPFIQTITDQDFFKEFEIVDPAKAEDIRKEEIKDLKDEIKEVLESQKSLEDLKKELEEEETENTEEVKEVPEGEKKEEVEEVKTNTSEYSFKPFMEAMSESGVLDLPEGSEVGETAEDLVEVFETTVNTRINKGIDEYKESIPELGKQFLDFLENGGDPRKFLVSQSGPIDFQSLDLTEEGNQKMVLKELLKSQGYTPEEITEEIQDYEDGLLLEKKAKVAVKKLQDIQSKQTDILIKQQEDEVKQREKDMNTYVSDIQKIIKESKEIAGLAIEDKEKKDFESYLFKRDKAGLTQYQKELQDNPNKTQVELAYLKFKKYDFAKAAKKGENTAAQKIRQQVLAKTETSVKGLSQDVTNKSSDLSAFEKWYKSMQKQ